jgi:hypothetical protein
MKGKGQYADEVAAIESLRAKNPKTGQKQLARQIQARNFVTTEEQKLSGKTLGRTLLSIYSVIRRYDKRIKGVVQQHLQPAGAY